jgi:hypothetical protein
VNTNILICYNVALLWTFFEVTVDFKPVNNYYW